MAAAVLHGEICEIEDVLCDTRLNCASVRLTGRLCRYDATTNKAVIEYNGYSIDVDTSILGQFDFRIDQLVQFIGETRREGQKIVLRARVGRNVEGLDMHLFNEALKIRREFLQQNFS